jgi:hypothetical protein
MIWLAHLSSRQRSSQISSKEVERFGASLLIALVFGLTTYGDSLCILTLLSAFTFLQAVILQSPEPSSYLQTSRGNDASPRKMTMVEDHDGIALPHTEQSRPISLRHSHTENNSGQ